MQKKAFTLIELLVVIAIIAILASILFPVFAQAKLAAKKISSVSNIKQTALAVLMYNNDYDDMFPTGCGADWWYPTGGGWAWNTQPYIKSLTLLRDPTDPLSTQNWATWMFPPDNPTVSISYASNGFFWQDSVNSWKTYMYGVMGMSQPSWMGNSYTDGSQVTQSAATIMFATRASGDDIFAWGDCMGANWYDNGNHSPAGEIPDGGASTTVPYTATNAAGNTYTVNADAQYGAVYTPYSGQSPFAFVDGHAKSMVPPQTDPNPNRIYVHAPNQHLNLYPSGHDPLNMWDAYR
jgi:prepilin-type N-terminal cleavage/methylation domain-containing protein/prepilin-type processing-associated H-X9-DG protein